MFKQIFDKHHLTLDNTIEESGVRIKKGEYITDWVSYCMAILTDSSEKIDSLVKDLLENFTDDVSKKEEIWDIYKRTCKAWSYWFNFQHDKFQEFYFETFSFEYDSNHRQINTNTWNHNYTWDTLPDTVKREIVSFEEILGPSARCAITKNETNWYALWNHITLDMELINKFRIILNDPKYVLSENKINEICNHLASLINGKNKFTRIAFSTADSSKLNIYIVKKFLTMF